MMGRMMAAVLCWGIMAAVAGAARAAEPPPVEAFAKGPPFTLLRLSPDGRHVAVNAEYDDGNYAVVVYRIDDLQPTAMLRLPRYELAGDIAWVSNERLVIAKARKTGSLERPLSNGELLATNVDGSRQTYLYGYEQTGRIAGLARGFGFIAGLPSVPNGHFYMRQYSREARRSMLYDVDASSGTGALLTDIGKPDLDFVLDASGRPRYAYGEDERGEDLLYQANAQGGWDPLPALADKWRPLALTADGQQVYGYYTEHGEPSALVLSDLAGQHRSVLASDPFFSAGSLQWRNGPESTPFLVELGNGRPAPRYLGEGQEVELYRSLSAALPGKALDFINYSLDGKRVLLSVYSDRDPGGWYLFDRDANKVRRLMLARPELDAAALGERRLVRFASRDGLELGAVLTFPAGAAAGAAPLPMVLLPHGGPHVAGDGWDFDSDAQFLASRGYLVLQVNYRGSRGRGQKFEQAGYRQWGGAIQDDLIDGVRWAIGQHLADPGRVCAVGASFGAYAAMMVAAREPAMFRCAVGMAGVYDLRMMYDKGDIQRSEWGRNYLARVIGEDPSALAASSPVTQAAKIRVPVLLVHGEKDERAPLAQANAMRAALQGAGNAPEWMAVPREGHGFYKEENNVALYRRLEAFLARNLAPVTTADAR